jgi:hypothetical protein
MFANRDDGSENTKNEDLPPEAFSEEVILPS